MVAVAFRPRAFLWACGIARQPGEVAPIEALRTEMAEHRQYALGAIILGDYSVLQQPWLQQSSQGHSVGKRAGVRRQQ